MDAVFMFINQNKIMWGMSMLLLQFGARYVLGDLGKAHEVLLSHNITKKLIVMAMFFVATRDIVVSFVLTIAYIVIIDGILHEDRQFSLIPSVVRQKIVQDIGSKIPQDDYKKAKEIVKLYETQNNAKQQISLQDMNDISYLKYVTNVTMATHQK
jgi:hypothetical protein